MDTRWILILTVVIAALGCGYSIIESSTTVGSAVTVIDKCAATVPGDFSVEESRNYDVTLAHDGTAEKIKIKEIEKNNTVKKEINNLTKSIKKSYKIQYNNTWKTPDKNKVYTIYYKNSTDNLSTSVFYVNKYTFVLNTTGYDNTTKLTKDVGYIVDTIRPDYKQSQD